MKLLFLIFSCSFTVFGLMQGSDAQIGLNPDSDKPLEITAEESLEWNRNELYFKAVKDVKAVQGDTTLISDLLLAKYRDGAKGGIDIYLVRAEGNVQIISSKSKAYGDKAVYDIEKSYAIMTGDSLRFVSDDQTVTASDSFKYWVADGRLEASGNAVAVSAGDKIKADKIIAIFMQDKSGARVLKTLEAIGHVVITTPSEVLTGGRAIYRASTNIAELRDNVKIARGKNILEGRHAQINMNTNVSKIIGGANTNQADNNAGIGRVRGVFYPDTMELDK